MKRGAVRIMVVLLLMSFCLVGCTMKTGRFVPHSQFVYPNSNIKILGPTYAKKSKVMFILPPKFKIKDLKQVYNEALSSQQGANVLVNFTEDTSYTQFLGLVNIMTYELRGNAAQMVVGEQELE